MYFQAEANGHKYEITVSETKTHWQIGLKEDADWIHYDVAKEDYRLLDETISFIFKDSSYLVDVIPHGTDYAVYTRGTHNMVKIYNEEKLLHESLKGEGGFGKSDSLSAGMPGKIVKVAVKKGDVVKEGEPLLVMEAMKMENEIRASHDVKIKEILVKEGANVESGVVLITFDTPT